LGPIFIGSGMYGGGQEGWWGGNVPWNSGPGWNQPHPPMAGGKVRLTI
jgi:hypothetical protein